MHLHVLSTLLQSLIFSSAAWQASLLRRGDPAHEQAEEPSAISPSPQHLGLQNGSAR